MAKNTGPDNRPTVIYQNRPKRKAAVSRIPPPQLHVDETLDGLWEMLLSCNLCTGAA